jgi:short-subunit dehydrogenase
MKKILIIGATSAIAEATARIWAGEGHRFFLVGRNQERLDAIATDLKVRGAAQSHVELFDVNDFERHKTMIDKAIETLGGIDIVLIAHGTLGDQKACEKDFNLALRELNTNAISVISLLTHVASYLEGQRHGVIACISSVAGDRGRQSNYVYGTAKGAVTIFLQGLRQRLFKSGVHVLTVKPGFVDTPMTQDFKKGMLWAKPEAIARCIHGGVSRQRTVVYTPSFWRIIMLLIRLIPENIFRRISL